MIIRDICCQSTYSERKSWFLKGIRYTHFGPCIHGLSFLMGPVRLHPTVLQSLQQPSHVSYRDFSHLPDRKSYEVRGKGPGATPHGGTANSRQDTVTTCATQGRRRLSVIRDVTSEGLLGFQGDCWNMPPLSSLGQKLAWATVSC